jgi:Ca2+-binding EF-hand superfamily protein
MLNEEDVRARFADFDTDKNGKIDEAEFANLVAALGIQLNSDEIATAFLAIDVNGNGKIEFGEFAVWWSKQTANT